MGWIPYTGKPDSFSWRRGVMTHAIHTFCKSQLVFVACSFSTSETFYPFMTSSPVCLGWGACLFHMQFIFVFDLWSKSLCTKKKLNVREVAVEEINNCSRLIPQGHCNMFWKSTVVPPRARGGDNLGPLHPALLQPYEQPCVACTSPVVPGSLLMSPLPPGEL